MTKFRNISGFNSLPEEFRVFENRNVWEEKGQTIKEFVVDDAKHAGIHWTHTFYSSSNIERTRIIEEHGFLPIVWAMKIGDRALCLHFLETMSSEEIEEATESAEEFRFVWDLFGIQ